MRWTTAIVIGCIGFATWTTYSTFVTKRSSAQIDELKDTINKRSDDNARLDREIGDAKRKLRALNDRPDVKERLIREDVGLVQKDELIFNFSPPRDN